jgi:hypothetical protein
MSRLLHILPVLTIKSGDPNNLDRIKGTVQDSTQVQKAYTKDTGVTAVGDVDLTQGNYCEVHQSHSSVHNAVISTTATMTSS